MTQPGPARRRLQRLGVFLFLLTAALPVYACDASPSDFSADPPRAFALQWGYGEADVPAVTIVERVRDGWRGGGLSPAYVNVRNWYPYLLLPLWILALVVVAASPARRRPVGGVLLAVSGLVLVLEVAYHVVERGRPELGGLRLVEGVVTSLLVFVLLAWRPRGVSRLEPEATVASQALLSFAHGIVVVGTDVVSWLGKGHDGNAILKTTFVNYRPWYWIALATLLVVALPVLVGRRRERVLGLPRRTLGA